MDHQTYLFILILILCLGFVGLVCLIHSRKKRPSTKLIHPANFHGVTIKTEARACYAVKQLIGKRFLAREAPNLPLADCNAQQCFCQYMHHPDRRLFKDRRQMLVYDDSNQNTEDQRRRKDRRITRADKDSQ